MSDITNRWSLHCRTFPRAVFFKNLFCAKGASALWRLRIVIGGWDELPSSEAMETMIC